MSNKSFSWRSIINMVAFVAICCIGVSLLVGQIGANEIASAFDKVAQILAYLITAIASFSFVISKRHWAYYVVWPVAVTLIIVILII